MYLPYAEKMAIRSPAEAEFNGTGGEESAMR